MADQDLKETCSCGATFHFVGYGEYMKTEVAKWRKEHIHEFPPERPKVTLL